MKRWRWLWLGMAVGLALALYGRGLSVPFYADDLMAIPLVHKLSWGELWSGSYVLGTYRPISYSVWKLFAAIWGFNPFPLKLLNLVLHVINGLLAGELARIWWAREASPARQRLTALAGTVFLVAFPWAYQAIPWVGCTFHPLVTLWALAAALAYDRMRRGGGWWWAALTMALVWLGPLTHELGFLLAPLLALVEARGRGTQEYERPRRGWLLWVGGMAMGVVLLYGLRQHIPGALTVDLGGERTISMVENLLANGSYLLQVVTYPTARISGALAHRAGLNDVLSVWLVAVPTLLAALAIVRREGRARWLTALAWPVVASSILLWFIRHGNLIDAPRQFTFAAPGIALFWAGGVASLAHRRSAACALLLLLVAPGVVPVAANMGHLDMLGEMLGDIAAAGQEAPADSDAPLLFVNLPAWTAHMPPPYALGHFGTQVLNGGYFPPSMVIHTANQKDVPTHDLAFVNLLPEVPYAFGLISARADWQRMAEAVRGAGAVYLTQYEPDQVYVLRAGRVSAAPPTGAPPLAAFEAGVELLAAEPVQAKGRPGVRLVWELSEGFTPDVEIFVHLYNAKGALISQADGPFLMGLYPLWMAQSGESITDYRYFGRQPQQARAVGVGLYDPGTGARVPAIAADGAPLPDKTFRLEVAP